LVEVMMMVSAGSSALVAAPAWLPTISARPAAQASSDDLCEYPNRVTA
jgi:hypothetical protein